jgi:hypothetical protein
LLFLERLDAIRPTYANNALEILVARRLDREAALEATSETDDRPSRSFSLMHDALLDQPLCGATPSVRRKAARMTH